MYVIGTRISLNELIKIYYDNFTMYIYEKDIFNMLLNNLSQGPAEQYFRTNEYPSKIMGALGSFTLHVLNSVPNELNNMPNELNNMQTIILASITSDEPIVMSFNAINNRLENMCQYLESRYIAFNPEIFEIQYNTNITPNSAYTVANLKIKIDSQCVIS